MADYLERLARRTLGQLDVARPDLMPQFGTRPIESTDAPPPELTDGPRDGASTAPAFNPPPDRTRHHDLIDDVRRAPGTAARAIEHAWPSPGQPSAAGAPLAPSDIVDRSTIAVSLAPSGIVDRSTLAVSLAPPASWSAAPAFPVIERSRRAARADAPASDVSVSHGAERPAVRITIGRIDVRAVTAAPSPAPARSTPRPSPLRSLESYLDERNGRRS